MGAREPFQKDEHARFVVSENWVIKLNGGMLSRQKHS
jgi:hypothetical protein